MAHFTLTQKSKVYLESGRYTVRLAKNRTEVESALRLRFDVFNVELGEGLQESYTTQMDEDKYDKHCDHLIVIENSSQKVIGTYRIQDNESAEKGEGFYTLNEFDISKFPEEVLTNAFELGRACIDRDHRNGRVLFLLWRGLAKYMIFSEKKYLFGCCSLTSQNPDEGYECYEFLKNEGVMHPDFLIPVMNEFQCEPSGLKIFSEDIKLPKLFQLYLNLGCKVCSEPALDAQFKTIDFLILLDIDTISEESKALFLK